MKEVWRPVVGYEEHYEVSNFGRVRSVDRVVTLNDRWGGTFERRFRGVLRVLSVDPNGYPVVHLYRPGSVKLLKVHRLVAQAFHPNPKNLPQVDHKDNDPSNPRANNLQWATGQGNMDFMVARGRSCRGAKVNTAKLTARKVRALRARAAKGKVNWRKLGAEFGVTDVAARKVALGETWRHL